MNKNEKFHQDAQYTSLEINDEALENVAGGASANAPGMVCTYCGRDDSFIWASPASHPGCARPFCTACSRFLVFL